MEVCSGICIAAWQAFDFPSSGLPASTAFYVALLTSAYLTVRGLDNMDVGHRDKEKAAMVFTGVLSYRTLFDVRISKAK